MAAAKDRIADQFMLPNPETLQDCVAQFAFGVIEREFELGKSHEPVAAAGGRKAAILSSPAEDRGHRDQLAAAGLCAQALIAQAVGQGEQAEVRLIHRQQATDTVALVAPGLPLFSLGGAASALSCQQDRRAISPDFSFSSIPGRNFAVGLRKARCSTNPVSKAVIGDS